MLSAPSTVAGGHDDPLEEYGQPPTRGAGGALGSCGVSELTPGPVEVSLLD